MDIGGSTARGMGILGAGALALLWSWGNTAAFFPDGYELAAAGACLWGQPEDPSLPCAEMDLGYTTPLFPLLAGLLGMGLGRLGGVVALAMMSMALCFVPLATMAQRLGGIRAVLATFVLLASSQELRAWALVPDERPLALFLAASAWAVMSTARTLPAAVAAGALAGLAGWARPEALAVAVLVPAVMLLWDRRKGAAAALASGLLLAGWLLTQRMLSGTWLPRPYEVAALELLQVLPDDWAKRLVGMGAWSPPVRAWGLQNHIAAPSGGMSPDLIEGVSWVGNALAQGTHPAHWFLAGAGVAAALWRRPLRRTVVAVVGLTGPWLLASALMHARLGALPLANLLVALLAVSVLAGAGAAHLAGLLAARIPGRGNSTTIGLLLATGIAVGTGLQWPMSPVRPGIERTPPGVAAAAWLQSHPGMVVSSYESAPIAFRSSQPWQEWPTPFEPERWTATDWVVRSHLDTPEPLSLAPGDRHLEEVAGWASAGQWVRIYRVSEGPERE